MFTIFFAVRQRHDNGVETSTERRGQLVDAFVAVVGGGYHIGSKSLGFWPSSGIGRVFSDRIVISASCTSAGIRVSSSIRAIEPCSIATITGEGTSACGLGPSASSRA